MDWVISLFFPYWTAEHLIFGAPWAQQPPALPPGSSPQRRSMPGVPQILWCSWTIPWLSVPSSGRWLSWPSQEPSFSLSEVLSGS